MIRRPPRSTRIPSSAASDVYKRQALAKVTGKSDSEVVNYITQSWMVDNFDREYDFWAAKIPEQK